MYLGAVISLSGTLTHFEKLDVDNSSIKKPLKILKFYFLTCSLS